MTQALISQNNTWALLAAVTGGAALSVYLEQKYKWASKISGMVLALISGMLLTNLNIIPTSAPALDAVYSYSAPLAVALLLLKCDIRKIWLESGRLLGVFLIGALGTCVGAAVSVFIFQSYIANAAEVAGIMTGSYIGGSINFVGLAEAFGSTGATASALAVADNLLMTLYFFVLLACCSMSFFKKHYKHPIIDKCKSNGENSAETYWKADVMGIKDIAMTFAVGAIIVAISVSLSDFFAVIIPTGNIFFDVLNGLFGNKYLIITSISMFVASAFPDVFGTLRGTQEIGVYLIYLFFFMMGVSGSISMIINNSPILLLFCAVMVLVNMLFVFVFGKLFRFDLEEIVIASNANIGGPTTAVAFAISQGWTSLVAPAMLVGTLGYVLGNYCGVLVFNLLK